MAKRKKDRTPYLYPNEVKGVTYYVYQHPLTGARTSLGSNLAEAKKAARIATARILAEGHAAEALVGKIISGRPSFATAADQFERHLGTKTVGGRPLSRRTLRHYHHRLERMRRAWGDKPTDAITVEDCAALLDALEPHAGVSHRSLGVQLFRFALAKGLRRPRPGEPENPMAATLKPDAQVRQRRLELPVYQAILGRAEALQWGWMVTAMELGLHTLQRRQTLVGVRYDDEREGRLLVSQAKVERYGTGHIAIPVGPKLREVIARSRDGLVCPYVVHRRPERLRRAYADARDHWAQLDPNTLSRAFSQLRDELGLCDRIPRPERPTFREIRPLGGYLYRQASWTEEEVQRLMGHSTVKTTQYYLDRRGLEIQYVEAPMAGLEL